MIPQRATLTVAGSGTHRLKASINGLFSVYYTIHTYLYHNECYHVHEYEVRSEVIVLIPSRHAKKTRLTVPTILAWPSVFTQQAGSDQPLMRLHSGHSEMSRWICRPLLFPYPHLAWRSLQSSTTSRSFLSSFFHLPTYPPPRPVSGLDVISNLRLLPRL